MLNVYYQKAGDLYPQEIYTMNVHSLIHLCQAVRSFGPLWSYSCFGFESMNGHLKRHCHGTRNVLLQLVKNLRFHQTTLDQEYRSQNHDDKIRGKIKLTQLTSEYLEALKNGNFQTHDDFFLVFPRYKLNGVLYQTWKNSKQLRDSSVCKFATSTGKLKLDQFAAYVFAIKFQWQS